MISPLVEQIAMPGELQSRMLFIFNVDYPSDGKELEFDFSLDDLETVKVIGKDSDGVFIFWFNYNIQKDPRDRLTSSELLNHPFIKRLEDNDLDLEILVGTLEPPFHYYLDPCGGYLLYKLIMDVLSRGDPNGPLG
ncbi:hypothetical protein RIF29_04848 [Crotalaria pallida]|uniref:Uncharacterized protein n=1 Tax=Crotalaria pallida TaxID=3830 RepID=A0AAN9J2V3_CROPI